MTVEELCLYTGRADATDDAFVAEIHSGDFHIRNGAMEIPGVQNGQYIRIIGSLYNDGIYLYPCTGLIDEDFHGAVFALRIPPAFIRLADDIGAWQDDYGAHAAPYRSESFGGYTYERATDTDTGAPLSWQAVFRRDLNRWKRI